MKTEAAKTAKSIREELKKVFPTVKFKVTSETYSMGDSVRISYEDGPLLELVTEITKKYQYGHFDGMTDMYENSNSRNDIPQTKYVFANRKMSESVKQELITFCKGYYEGFTDYDSYNDRFGAYNYTLVYREFVKRDYLQIQEAA